MAASEPRAKNLADLYDLAPLDWADVRGTLETNLTQEPGTGGPGHHTFWLSTIDADGRPHMTAVGAFWVDGRYYFSGGPRSRKIRNVERDPRCAFGVAIHGYDVALEGQAVRVTDDALLHRVLAPNFVLCDHHPAPEPGSGLGEEATVVDRMIEANGVELCTESFGDPADPAILLIAGMGSSMLWWEEDFCRMVAGGGRFVIRYDHRDTGRSVTYEPGRPGYTGADLVGDAAGLLDAFGVRAAHIVGVSAGGAFAQLLALDFAERVVSLVLISTSPATPGDRALPPPTAEFKRFVSTAEVDWTNSESIIEYLVEYSRVLAGGQRPFDERAARDLAHREVARARNIAAVQNHDHIADGGSPSRRPLSTIAAPTLVIHGTADPMFPLEHAKALAREIPGATLLPLEGAGHGVERTDWETITAAIVGHTAPTSSG